MGANSWYPIAIEKSISTALSQGRELMLKPTVTPRAILRCTRSSSKQTNQGPTNDIYDPIPDQRGVLF